MKLHTERLTLVPLGIKYLESTHEYSSDKDVTKYMFFHNENIETTAAFLIGVDLAWNQFPITYYEFAILFENKHVGAISLYIEDDRAEIGWILNKKYWNRGIISEAAFKMVEFAKSLGLKKLTANCDSENIASYKVMEKIGMKRVSDSGKRKNFHADVETIEYQYEMDLGNKCLL
ncbi:GNAT family N-acetyltransferase [Acholeplasma hippikon]|uniref:Predicted acetyltransferase n=1 Tax=Acholeplasma hippikon TaxID=264636 RepID=A0A449BKG2_9MOLU|nr:GNAT family N-acetyltransferase [Acholeplasma hippikon]VEU82827.1 Predicted acetyltransferase [Acholeplasma hippikon]